MTRKKMISILLSGFMAAALTSGCGSSAGEGGPDSSVKASINFFCWTEYMPQGVLDKFEEETGIHVNMSTYSSNEDMLAKVKSEVEGTYDVIVPSDYMVEQMASQGMLEELDHKALSNLSNIGSAYLSPSYDPDNKYSVPYQGGVAAIAVNTSKVDLDITSYGDLFDPALQRSVVALDDYRAVIGMTARSMGYSMNETDPETLAEIEEKLMTLKENIKLYDSDSPKSALISGDCTVGFCWGAEIALTMEEDSNYKIVYPSEGAYLFMDNLAIPKGSKHYDEAMQFINFVLDPENSKMISEEFPYLNPNVEAIKLLGDDFAGNVAKNPPQEVIAMGEYVTNLDPDTIALYDEMWTKLKQ